MSIMSEFNEIKKQSDVLGELLRAKRELGKVLNPMPTRRAARELGRAIANLDVKYGPQKIDWDDLRNNDR